MFGLGKIFGLNKNKEIESMANIYASIFEKFDKAVILACAVKRISNPPEVDDRYLSIFLGMCDAFSQCSGQDLLKSQASLRLYLNRFSDADLMFQRFLSLDQNGENKTFKILGGETVFKAKKLNEKIDFLKLAEAYIEMVAN